MLRAIQLSRSCVSEAGKVAPKVGAVVARDGVVLGEAFRGEQAEHNTLMELIGPATDAAWKPQTEIFADKEHLAPGQRSITSALTMRW